MKISDNNFCNNHYTVSNRTYSYNNNSPSFEGAKSRKFLEMLRKTENCRKIKATFQDMVDAYAELGYDCLMKRGSHAIVRIDEGFNLPLPIPHKGKDVNFKDIKRLQMIALGDIEAAMTDLHKTPCKK